MARMSFEGLEETIEAVEKSKQIPTGTYRTMLKAMSRIVGSAQERKAREMLGDKGYGTGTTASSIAVRSPVIEGGLAYQDLSFDGERRRGNISTRNAAIAYYNEFGVKSKKIKARPFIKKANQESAERANDAAARVLHDWMKNNGL